MRGPRAAAQEVRPRQNESTVPQRFEVVSIRPVPEDRMGELTKPQGVEFHAQAMPLSVLVQMAFGVSPNLIVLPDWTQGAKFDIAAKPGGDTPLIYQQMKPLLQTLLTERFGMTFHRETRDVRGYEMVAAKAGLKLTPAKADTERGGTGSPTAIVMPSATMQALAGMLAVRLKQPVRDRTEASGNYQVDLHFAREDDTEPTLPTLFTALQEDMGLRLISAKVPVEMVVIDHLERKPTEN